MITKRAVVSLLNEIVGAEEEHREEEVAKENVSVDELQDSLITRHQGRPKGWTMAKRFRSGREVSRTKKKVTFQQNAEVLGEKMDQTAVVAETDKSVSGNSATGQKSTKTKKPRSKKHPNSNQSLITHALTGGRRIVEYHKSPSILS